jgi:hypothetical protein
MEEEDEKSIFSGLMKREEETSILSRLMKMEDEEEKKKTFVFSGVIERGDNIYWEMVSDHFWVVKIRSRPHHPKTTGDQA